MNGDFLRDKRECINYRLGDGSHPVMSDRMSSVQMVVASAVYRGYVKPSLARADKI